MLGHGQLVGDLARPHDVVSAGVAPEKDIAMKRRDSVCDSSALAYRVNLLGCTNCRAKWFLPIHDAILTITF